MARMSSEEPRSVPDPAGVDYDAMMKRWLADQQDSEAARAAEASLPMAMVPDSVWPVGPNGDIGVDVDDLREALREFQNGPRIGHPGLLESLVPLWGSGREALADLQERDYPWAAFNGALTLADGGVGSSVAEGLLKGAVKTAGPYVWRTKPWLQDIEKGVMDASTWMRQPRALGMRHLEKGQAGHHWAVPQNGWGKIVPDWIKNQPWNIKPMPDPIVHARIHGPYRQLRPFNWLERLHYGVPTWPKLLTASYLGRAADRVFDHNVEPPPRRTVQAAPARQP